MRFALRCIICLAFVYAAILRHDGYLVDPGRLAAAAAAAPTQAGNGIAAALAPRIAAKVETACRADPAACLTAAATPLGLSRPRSALASRSTRVSERFAP